MVARAWDNRMSFGGDLEGLGIPVDGVRGEIDVGQTEKGLSCRSFRRGGVGSPPPLEIAKTLTKMMYEILNEEG